MLPGLSGHYIDIALNGFYVFGVVQIKVQQMVAAQIVPIITTSDILEITVFGCLERTGNGIVSTCAFCYVITYVQVGMQIF